MRITTIGDGAMATVCSRILASKGHAVTMWVRLPEDLAMLREGENRRYLPGIRLPAGLSFTGDDAEAFAAGGGCELVLAAVPAQYMRGTLGRLAGHVPAGVPVASVVKGIEVGTLRRPSEVVREVLGERSVCALSGPNIAGELAREMPATMVATSADGELARRVQELFTTPWLRVYTNRDIVGVELAGALKNVIAIAAGMLDGLRAGNNAKAALVTRGLVEISRLGVAMGAEPETFAGLAGLGDLVTTCVSPEGRNRTFGEKVGGGQKPGEVLARQIAGVVEGMPTTQGVLALAKQYGVEMPISQSLHGVLYENVEPRVALAELMSREPKQEGAGGEE